MNEADRKRRRCEACGKPVGTATIVCGGPFPDAPLCLQCGTRVDYDVVCDMIRKRWATEKAVAHSTASGDPDEGI